MTNEEKFVEWYNTGIEEGFISPYFCWTHDGFPMTEEEEEGFEDGGDPCVPGTRFWFPWDK